MVACRGIDLEVRPQEIHALLGENGAGKTTLVNILYGLIHPDRGEVRLGGDPFAISSPKDAISAGIGMVHQHPLLIPRLTVAENALLGTATTGSILAETGEVERRLADLSEQYGIHVDAGARVWDLSAGECQRVEILKALYRGARILILDEPTSSLTPHEAEILFRVLRSMVEKGLTVIFITHRLEEVMTVCDRVSVLRNGKRVETVDAAATTKMALARMMVGREVLFEFERDRRAPGEPILEVADLVVLDDLGRQAVRGVSFQVRTGEVFGIAGVSGNGQRELAEALVGMRKPSAGAVRLAGRAATTFSPREMIDLGMSYLPEDPLAEGGAADLSVLENSLLKAYYSNSELRRGPFIRDGSVRDHVQKLIDEYQVKVPGLAARLSTLSGGNLRKLILARELARTPRLLVANQPTGGLDVAAAEYVSQRILEQRDQGRAVILISDNLDEIFNLSDVVGVMSSGRLMGIVPIWQADRGEIGLMMGGETQSRTG